MSREIKRSPDDAGGGGGEAATAAADPAAAPAAEAAPETFGEPITAGDTLPPGTADEGASGREAIGDLPDPDGPPLAPPGFMDTKWPADAVIPEGFDQYDTPGKALTALGDAKRKISEQGDQLSNLRTEAKQLREGKMGEANAALWSQAESEIADSGGITVDTAEALSPQMGITPALLMVIGGLIHRQAEVFNAKASEMLGGEENTQSFLAKLSESGLFTQPQLDAWNAQATEGDTSWVPFAAGKLGMPVTQPAAAPASPDESPSPGVLRGPNQIETGDPTPPPPGPDVYGNRQEYLNDLQAAQAHYDNNLGDESKLIAAKEKLRRSDVRAWGAIHGG